LTRKEIADKYECTLETDVTIHASGYTGPISNVNEAGAKHLVESKTGFLVEKPKKKQPSES
jgi:hypothetical protein